MKNKQINFRISEQDKKYLSDYCVENGTTITNLFDEFIQSKINSHIIKYITDINNKEIGHKNLFFTSKGWLDENDFDFINKTVYLSTIRMDVKLLLERNLDKYIVINTESLNPDNNEIRIYIQ